MPWKASWTKELELNITNFLTLSGSNLTPEDPKSCNLTTQESRDYLGFCLNLSIMSLILCWVKSSTTSHLTRPPRGRIPVSFVLLAFHQWMPHTLNYYPNRLNLTHLLPISQGPNYFLPLRSLHALFSSVLDPFAFNIYIGLPEHLLFLLLFDKCPIYQLITIT